MLKDNLNAPSNPSDKSSKSKDIKIDKSAA